MSISNGARDLQRYIEKHFNGSYTAFSRHTGLDRAVVSRLVRGLSGANMSVNLALKIQRITDGVVRVERWET